jgi:peptide/nickel transport system permease protein
MNDGAASGSVEALPEVRGSFATAWDSDLAFNFRRSPVAMISAIVLAICLFCAVFAPWQIGRAPCRERVYEVV